MERQIAQYATTVEIELLKRISYAELSQWIGCSRNTVIRWLAGDYYTHKKSYPNAAHIKQMKELGIWEAMQVLIANSIGEER